MSEKKPLKISMSTVFLIISIIVIILLAFYIFINNSNNNKKINDLNNKILSQQSTINGLEENNVALSLANNNVSNQSALDNSTDNNVSEEDNVSYEIVKKDEVNATINATLDGKTVSKDFEMDAMIDKTGTMFIPDIGNVAMISESGGEYCLVQLYKLENDDIVSVGRIDCGADMDPDVDYVVSMKNDSNAVITVNRKDDNVLTNELALPLKVNNVNVVDIFDYGKVILFSKSGLKTSSSLAYRLSIDYTTGNTIGILGAGVLYSADL